ncbi:hypothetical protein PHAVU_002G102750 [Phaseolus vulgaris]|uniref:Uncharacterized protein n=1 Tax=Phaseolus vulgaris TaxID=3885 RepID=V7B4T6_PHAVU|nr:hypothetical protein PHAVU_008G152100g [Phaseolus vulgaris]ESW12912.1 hypothetical protein PHAVU_008G152100g [Phaseolus vulgaris]
MAQQQLNREKFGTDQRDYDVRHNNPDICKNNDELDRWRDEFGSRTTVDPVANYAYGNIGNGGYGAPPTGGPYSGTNYGASGFEYSTTYSTTGAPPGYGTAPAGQGNADHADGGGDSGRNMTNVNINRNKDMDQKK